ncbi:hypothetical protein TNCV_420541 [Trichonephila clavipes]|nr:hypothetical protein TNCV_420541 [Trichonephila clavipes]
MKFTELEVLSHRVQKRKACTLSGHEIIAAGGVSVPNLKLEEKELDNGQSRIETKQKIKIEETDEIRIEFKLTEEACDKTTPRKLSGTSDNNTYNPVGVYQPFNDRSMTGPSIEPSPVPVLDMSRANPIVQKKNIKATSKK